MTTVRPLSLPVLLVLAGCDAGSTAYYLSNNRNSHGNREGSSAPSPDYTVWIADLPDAAAADAQRDALVAAGGVPDPAVWTQAGSGTATSVFDPPQAPGSFNAILIQTTDVRNYNLDAIEVLDAGDAVVGSAFVPLWSDRIALPGNVVGSPDGLTATLTADASGRAFLFARFAVPIEKFRLTIVDTGVVVNPSPAYRVWIAGLADAAAAEAQRAAMAANGGHPDPAVWTEAGNGIATAVFDPLAPPASFNAILVQTSNVRDYGLDGIEVLDGGNNVVGTAFTPTYSDRAALPGNVVGPPDGLTSTLSASAASRAFLFTVFAVPIEKFRVTIGDAGVVVVPSPAYRVWIAGFPDAASADAQRAGMVANGGHPDPAVWSEVGTGTGTAVFDPSQAPGSFNAILIQTTDVRNYNLDAVDVLDAGNNVVETTLAPSWSDLAILPENVVGPPDGQVVTLAATAFSRAFLFSRYAGPIEKFRVTITDTGIVVNPSPAYRVWTAALPDAAAAEGQRAAMAANGGNPDPAVWTEVGTGTATAVFDPPQAPGSFNAVLVQTTNVRNYNLDAIEILDAGNAVIETAFVPAYSNLVGVPDNAVGPPDGQVATLAATAAAKAFWFARHARPIEKFRVTIADTSVAVNPSPAYRVWIARLADAAAADAQQAAMAANGGHPDPAVWSEVGAGTATAVFDPLQSPADFNAILIQTSNVRNYALDAVEILDAGNNIVETTLAPVWSSLAFLPGNVVGPPDGQGAALAATASNQAFLFARYAGPIEKFRVTLFDAGTALDPSTAYKVWIASLADAAAADAQRAAMAAGGGNPDPLVWTEVGSGTATAVFDPSQAAGSFNTILVQTTNVRNYNLDAVEILDAGNGVIETAFVPAYSDGVTLPGNAVGPPDGQVATMAATAANKAFFFSRYARPIEKFRVTIADTSVAVNPSPAYRVWIAALPDVAAADVQQAAMAANGGHPDPAVWSEVGTGTATAVFDPAQAPGSFNAILIQTTDVRAYNLDAVEILDAADTVVETASAPTGSGLAALPGNAVGPPDGQAAALAATAAARAFLFTRYVGPIEKFRVNIFSGARASGDVAWVSDWPVPGGSETPGGAAVDAAGTLYLMAGDGPGPRNVRLLRFAAGDGALQPVVDVAAGVTAAVGNHAVAIDAAGNVCVAATVAAGDILVRKYSADLSTILWSGGQALPLVVDRVEANGIAVDGAGNVVVAGGSSPLGAAVDHWLAKFDGATGGQIWARFLAATDPADTYWHAVATDALGNIYTAGDLTSLASGFIEVFTRRQEPAAGNTVWSAQIGDNTAPPDVGHAIAVDGGGNAIVGGSFGTAVQGRNGVLLKYNSAGFLAWVVTLDGPAGGDDEILDVAVDADGSVYAAGYVTVAGQGENMWVRRCTPAGAVVWERTWDGGVGNDRAVSLVLGGPFVYVSGYRTVAGMETDIHVRTYVK